MLDLNVQAPDLDRIVTDLAATEGQVKRAFNSTLRKFATWLRQKSAKGLSDELKIKISVIRRRLKQLRVRTTPNGSQITVWYGLNPVALIYLGARKSADGVTAQGGRSVKGAFIAGHGRGKQVFKRVGQARLPITRQEAGVQPQAEPYLERGLLDSAEFDAKFWSIFEHELQWQTR